MLIVLYVIASNLRKTPISDDAMRGLLYVMFAGVAIVMVIEGLEILEMFYKQREGINTIKSLVRSGLGVTVISALAVQKELAEGLLERVPLAGRPIRRELRVVWNEHSSREFVEEFRNFCRRLLSAT